MTSVSSLFGNRTVLAISFFFVPIHELSHYIAAKLCGHKVTRVSFFTMNSSGVLGFVEHQYRPSLLSPFSNMLIGLAPIIGCISFLILLYHVFSYFEVFTFPSFPDHYAVVMSRYTLINPLTYTVATIQTNASNPYFYLYFFLVLNIVMYCVPSKADFAGAAGGIAVTITLLVSLLIFDLVSFESVKVAVSALSCALMIMITVALYQLFLLFFFVVFNVLISSIKSNRIEN